MLQYAGDCGSHPVSYQQSAYGFLESLKWVFHNLNHAASVPETSVAVHVSTSNLGHFGATYFFQFSGDIQGQNRAVQQLYQRQMCSGCSGGRGGGFKLPRQRVTDHFYIKSPQSPEAFFSVVRTGVLERVRYLTVSSVSCDWTADAHHHTDAVCVWVLNWFIVLLMLCGPSVRYQKALSAANLTNVFSDHYSYIKTDHKACN